MQSLWWCLVDTSLSRIFLEQLVLVGGNLTPNKNHARVDGHNSCINRNSYKFDQILGVFYHDLHRFHPFHRYETPRLLAGMTYQHAPRLWSRWNRMGSMGFGQGGLTVVQLASWLPFDRIMQMTEKIPIFFFKICSFILKDGDVRCWSCS